MQAVLERRDGESDQNRVGTAEAVASDIFEKSRNQYDSEEQVHRGGGGQPQDVCQNNEDFAKPCI